MPPDRVEHLTIRTSIDVQHARRVLRLFAARCGMSTTSAEELVLAASELGTNLVKHSKSGGELTFWVQPLGDGSDTPMLQVQSQDSGPGITDVEHSLEDGYSTLGTLGSGLPAIRRLADSFSITSGPDGTKITIAKRISRS